MTCTQYLEAIPAALWGAMWVHLVVMAIALTAVWFLVKSLKRGEIRGDLKFLCQISLILCIFIAIGSLLNATLSAHSAVYPEDTGKAAYYCADNPPTIMDSKSK